MTKPKIVIGRTDIIDLPEFSLKGIQAKVDTGAYTSAIHCSKIKTIKVEGEEYVTFHIPNSHIKGTSKKLYKTNDFLIKNIKSSSGHIERRFVIKTKIVIFNKSINTEFSLTDRSQMKFPILLGRKLLSKRFIVDVSSVNLSYKRKLQKL
ncbi:ATP-dependent zinc protease [soil metagenome]